MSRPSNSLVALTLLMTLVLLAACAERTNAPDNPAPTEGPYEVTVQEQQLFSPSDWPQELLADLYLPDTNGDHRPALLMVHGGGWEGRSRSDMDRAARHLAQNGFVVMNVDYRFAPEYQFPEQLYDVQIAMHWLHDRASDLQIDPERIGAFGFSSGAHLVSLMALVAGQGGELDRPYGGIRTQPYAVVAGGTPSDLRKFDDGRLVEQFLGGIQAEVPDRYHDASPIVHRHADAPPFFLFHGTLDRLVPPDHARDFHQALEREGVDSELFMQRLRGHATSYVLMGDARRAAVEFLWRHH